MKKRCFVAFCAAVCALALVTGCSSETDEPEESGIVYDADKWLIEGRTVMRYTGTETDVQIPDGVTVIGKHAFESRTAVASVTLPDSVAIIEDYAFSGCTGLADVNLPESVAMIGWNAFSGCASLASVTIPDGVTSIGQNAFSNCSGLKSVTIPASVETIGSFAFYGCESLTKVTIPASVEAIGNSAFYGCESLDTVTYQGDLAQWCALDGGGNLMSSAKHVTIGGEDLQDMTELVIPDGVTVIGSVTIPAGVKTIGYNAFYECNGFTEVTIPEGVTEIGLQAFYYCRKLTTVAIPVSVESIGYYAFNSCSKLTDVTYGGTQAQWDKIEKGSSIFPYSISTITGKDGEEINVGN